MASITASEPPSRASKPGPSSKRCWRRPATSHLTDSTRRNGSIASWSAGINNFPSLRLHVDGSNHLAVGLRSAASPVRLIGSHSEGVGVCQDGVDLPLFAAGAGDPGFVLSGE